MVRTAGHADGGGESRAAYAGDLSVFSRGHRSSRNGPAAIDEGSMASATCKLQRLATLVPSSSTAMRSIAATYG
jgi:hypothetical protein